MTLVDVGTQASWCAQDTNDVVGELYGVSDVAAAAVVFPGPMLALPQSTVRNLRSLALLRSHQGSLWLISVVGYRWTGDRLAGVSAMLEAHGEAHPDAALTNRLSDQLGLPGIRVDRPKMSDLDGSTWNLRPLAVAVGLARVFARWLESSGAITSAEADELAIAIRGSLTDALAIFARVSTTRHWLCARATASRYCWPTTTWRPLSTDAIDCSLRVCYRSSFRPWGRPTMRPPISKCVRRSSVGQPLANLVCRSFGVGPSVFRCMLGANRDVRTQMAELASDPTEADRMPSAPT